MVSIKSIIFVSFLLLSTATFGQDEEFVRDMFSGKLREKERAPFKPAKYREVSPYYKIDLTDDGIEEAFVREIRDGRYWFHLHNAEGERIFSYKFDVQGVDAELQKVAIKEISPETKVMLLYFYEGKAAYQHFLGSARLYFLTIDHNDLSTASMEKGPYYWHEERILDRAYWRRKRKISVLDLNGDNKKEILLKYHDFSEVYYYVGAGKWKSI